MLRIKFISLGYVGRSIYAENITLNDQLILPSAYLASSMVTIISDNDSGQDKEEVEAMDGEGNAEQGENQLHTASGNQYT